MNNILMFNNVKWSMDNYILILKSLHFYSENNPESAYFWMPVMEIVLILTKSSYLTLRRQKNNRIRFS